MLISSLRAKRSNPARRVFGAGVFFGLDCRVAALLAMTVIFFAVPEAANATGYDWHLVKTLKCEFNKGVSFDGDSLEKNSKPFGDSPPLVIDAIDFKKNSARLIGSAGASDLVIVGVSESLTLAERTYSGNLAFTTISPKKEGDFYVVTSRHMIMFDKPIFSQSYGTCKIFN